MIGAEAGRRKGTIRDVRPGIRKDERRDIGRLEDRHPRLALPIVLLTGILAALGVGYARPWFQTQQTNASVEGAIEQRAFPARTFATWRNEGGTLYRGQVDGDAFANFLRERHVSTQLAKAQLHQRNRILISGALDQAFASFEARVPVYADWYYAYSTRYVLMGHALESTARHIVSNPIVSFRGRESPVKTVSEHLKDYLHEQFAVRVLHPDQTKSDIQHKLDQVLGLVQADWQRHVLAQQDAMNTFVISRVRSSRRIDEAATPVVSIDWDGQGLLGSFSATSEGEHRFRRGLIRINVNAPLDGLLTLDHDDGEDSTEEASRIIVNLFDKLADPVASELSNVIASVIVGAAGAAAVSPAAAMIGLGSWYRDSHGCRICVDRTDRARGSAAVLISAGDPRSVQDRLPRVAIFGLRSKPQSGS